MIIAFYWIIVAAISALVFYVVSVLSKKFYGLIASLLVVLLSFPAYYFHFEQYFVRNYGGSMSTSVPDGQVHIHATWKESNLWIENYDPKTNQCIFKEFSKGGLLEGQVVIDNCNPIGVKK